MIDFYFTTVVGVCEEPEYRMNLVEIIRALTLMAPREDGRGF